MVCVLKRVPVEQNSSDTLEMWDSGTLVQNIWGTFNSYLGVYLLHSCLAKVIWTSDVTIRIASSHLGYIHVASSYMAVTHINLT